MAQGPTPTLWVLFVVPAVGHPKARFLARHAAETLLRIAGWDLLRTHDPYPALVWVRLNQLKVN